jgi:hypothetical protein
LTLLEQNAASLRAEGAPDAMVSVVQREAVAQILAEVCDATGANEDESIRVISTFAPTRRCRSGIRVNHQSQRQISRRTMSLSRRSIPFQ